MTAPKEMMLTFTTLRRQVSIEGRLVMETAFRIGTGRDVEAHTPDLPIIRDMLGRPFIPGSSMKGAMRSAVEAIARAFAPRRVEKAACMCTGDPADWCVSPKQRDEMRWEERNGQRQRVSDAKFAQRLWRKTCRVCRVFGSPWFAGKLRISDLPLCDQTDGVVTSEIRDSVAIDRDTGTAAHGKLFQHEVAPAGLSFSLHASIDNPNMEEIGMVLIGIKLLERGEIRVGGATSRGLGSCVLEVDSIKQSVPRDVDSFVAYLLDGQSKKMSDVKQKDCIDRCLKRLTALQPSTGNEGGTPDAQDAPQQGTH